MSWIIEDIQKFGDKVAIADQACRFSYLDLFNQIETYTNYLNSKFEDNQVVVILSDYNIYAVALFLALLPKKAIIIPIVSNNTEEIENRLKVVNCDWVIQLNAADLELMPQAKATKHPMMQSIINQNKSGLVLFSSGSTGAPKAMIHNLDNLIDSYKHKKQKNLNILVFLMFDHIGGLNTLFNAISMGATIVLPKNRNPEDIAALIEQHSVHVLPASPTFLNMMLMAKVEEKYNLTSLKMITYGTETMPESLLEKLKLKFPRTKLVQTFGTSETGIAQTTSRTSNSLEMKLDTQNLEYKIINGELWLKTKTQVLGYLNASMENFTEDGWFKTGDLVEELEDGYIRIIGRAKEIINVGGEKVLPAEIESVILEVTEVDDCLVYGEKNAITGQIVAVQIVLKPNTNEKEAKKNIRTHCKLKLELYKVPVKFEFVDKTNYGDRFKKKRLNDSI